MGGWGVGGAIKPRLDLNKKEECGRSLPVSLRAH